MEQVLKESNLLKQYINTLEQQNQSRNRQRKILTQQLDRLSRELEKSTNRASSSLIPPEQTKKFQDQNHTLLMQKQALVKQYNADIAKVTQNSHALQIQVQSLTNQINVLKASSANLQKLNCIIKQLQNEKKEIQNTLKRFQDQNNQLKITIRSNQASQQILTEKLSSMKILNNGITNCQEEFKRKTVEYETIIRQLLFEKQNYNAEVIRMREKVSSKNNITNENYKIEIQLKQAKNQLNDLQYEYNKLERERISQQNKIRQLENECIEKSSRILRLQKQESLEETYQTNLQIKEKQILTLLTLNQNLKEQVDENRQIMRKKDNSIMELQQVIHEMQQHQNSQISHYQEVIQHKDKQIKNLLDQYHSKLASTTFQIKSQRDQRKSRQQQNSTEFRNLFETVKRLQIEKNQIKQQSENYKSVITTLRKENVILKQNVEVQMKHIHQIQSVGYAQNRGQARGHQRKDSELMNLVNGLKLELNQVKQSNQKMAEQNLKMQLMVQKYINQDQSAKFNTLESRQHINRSQELMMGEQFMGRKIRPTPNQFQHQFQWIRRPNQNQPRIAPNFQEITNKNTIFNSAEGRLNQFRKNLHLNTESRGNYTSKNESMSVDKMVVNHQKWQNLQKKINALRQENQELKKSLFQ